MALCSSCGEVLGCAHLGLPYARGSEEAQRLLGGRPRKVRSVGGRPIEPNSRRSTRQVKAEKAKGGRPRKWASQAERIRAWRDSRQADEVTETSLTN